MPVIGAAAAAGPRVSSHVDQALAQSSLPHIPALAQAAKESHYSIQDEMTAWETDQDPTHLLRVISMLQSMLYSHTNVLQALASEAHAAHSTIREIAGDLDRGGGPATGSPVNFAGGSVTAGGGAHRALSAVADLARRMPESHIQPALKAGLARPVPAMLNPQSLLLQQHQLLEQAQQLERVFHEAAFGIASQYR
jgi:hypothetical protein